MIDLDRAIQDALNGQVLPGYYWLFRAITLLGSAGLWLIILAVCMVIGRWRKIASVLFIVIAFSMIVNEDVKEIVQRIRPGDVIISGYFAPHSYSFPSGHTQTVFAIATVLSAFLDRRYNIITFLLAATVGMSRIYLGVHFFTDVLAGAAAGIALGVLAIYCLEKLGFYGGDGMFKIAPCSKLKGAGKRQQDTGVLKYAIFILVTGFLAANIAFYLSDYLLSLATLGTMYIILLFLPTLFKARSSFNC